MNFLKRLWQRIFNREKECTAPSQHLVCPNCFTPYGAQTVFCQSATTFEETATANEWLYTCGTCRTISNWHTDTDTPRLLHIDPVGVSIETVRKEVNSHFHIWLPVRRTPENQLAYVAERLAIIDTSLSTHNDWKAHRYANNGYCANAVDLIIYGLLISGNHNICQSLDQINMGASTEALENYMNTQIVSYNTLALRAHVHIKAIRAAAEAAKKVPYVFVEPAVHAASAELLKIGVILLQRKQINYFHTHVSERLHHFAFMSA